MRSLDSLFLDSRVSSAARHSEVGRRGMASPIESHSAAVSVLASTVAGEDGRIRKILVLLVV